MSNEMRDAGFLFGALGAIFGLSYLRSRVGSRSAAETGLIAAVKKHPFMGYAETAGSSAMSEEALPAEVVVVSEIEKKKSPEVPESERLKFIKDDYESYKKEVSQFFKDLKEHPVKTAGGAMLSAGPGGGLSLGEKVKLFQAFRLAGKEGLVAEFTRISIKKPRIRLLGVVPVPNPVRYATLDKGEVEGPTYQQMEEISQASPDDLKKKGEGWFSSLFKSKEAT
jgi:hypothetical protein